MMILPHVFPSLIVVVTVVQAEAFQLDLDDGAHRASRHALLILAVHAHETVRHVPQSLTGTDLRTETKAN